jgi:hypothetical protein
MNLLQSVIAYDVFRGFLPVAVVTISRMLPEVS